MTMYNYYVSDTKTKKKKNPTRLITLQLSYTTRGTTRAHTACFWLQSEELIIIAPHAHRETEEISKEGRQIEECK